VAERTREIGVRSALGATPGQIIQLVLEQGARVASLGMVLGILGSFGFTRYLRALLFGVEPTDPATILGVVVLIGIVAMGGCVVPALRAARVDPSQSLRTD
jgi:ABC-type antimicrobial peptide transport system permease subunit